MALVVRPHLVEAESWEQVTVIQDLVQALVVEEEMMFAEGIELENDHSASFGFVAISR